MRNNGNLGIPNCILGVHGTPNARYSCVPSVCSHGHDLGCTTIGRTVAALERPAVDELEEMLEVDPILSSNADSKPETHADRLGLWLGLGLGSGSGSGLDPC